MAAIREKVTQMREKKGAKRTQKTALVLSKMRFRQKNKPKQTQLHPPANLCWARANPNEPTERHLRMLRLQVSQPCEASVRDG
jgi:hypothetical protein